MGAAKEGKRKAQQTEKETAKKAKVEEVTNVEDDLTIDPADEEKMMDAFRQCQEELAPLEKDLSQAQLEIEEKFYHKMAPIYKKRDQALAEIKNFWALVLLRNPVMESVDFISPPEAELIEKYLHKIELEEFLDKNGSYEIRLIFDEKCKEVFSPNVLSKRVTYEEPGADPTKITPTDITFVDSKKDPREMAKMLRQEGKDQSMTLFSWFSSEDLGLFAEVFRQEIYASPEKILDPESDEECCESCSGDDDEEEDQ